MNNGTQIQQVLSYRAIGWPVIPIPYREKNPGRSGWQDERLDEQGVVSGFEKLSNIGLLLGLGPESLEIGSDGKPRDPNARTNGIVDIDLDSPIARGLAGAFLPKTNTIFGRPSAPGSHAFYRMIDPAKTHKWADPTAPKDSATIVELRSTGAYTVIPTSWHKDTGEEIRWMPHANMKMPFVTWGEIEPALNRLAAISLLIRHWNGSGSRHDAALMLAGGLAAGGWDEEDTISLIQMICRATGDEDEVARNDRTLAVRSTYERYRDGQPVRGFNSLGEIMDPRVSLTIRRWLVQKDASSLNRGDWSLNDTGNAVRLVDQNQDNIRFNYNTGTWLIWNGMNWDGDGALPRINHLAKNVQERLHEEAVSQPDPKSQALWHNFAVTTGNRARIEGMITLASTDPKIHIRSDDLDQHPWKFNCANGTLDLETMSFYPNRRDDHITHRSPVRYDASAKPFEPWENYLNDITDGDTEKRRFLQKAAGYSMTGSVEEEVFFFAYGAAATGKTTFLEAIRMVMGDYAQTLNPETLLMGRTSGSGGPRPDLAKLRGARFVTAVEVDEGRRMAAALIKQLTGGDFISARFLHQNEIEFRPEMKLWIAANDAPYASSTDEAMKRRFIRIPFDHQVPTALRNTSLKAVLSDPLLAGPAILAWMIEGYRMWQREGLGVVKVRAIVNSNKQYWTEMDPLQDFLDSVCVIDSESTEFATALREEYVDWAKKNGVRMINDTEWGKQMRAHGFESCWKSRKKGWRGLHIDMNRHQLVDMNDREENISAD